MRKVLQLNLYQESWRKATLPPNATLEQAIRKLNEVGIKIVMVVSETGVLQGTISDGDIRRGLLKGLDLKSSVSSVVRLNAFVVSQGLMRDTVIQLMRANKIHQIPVVDDHRKLVGLHLWDEITSPSKRSNSMVIMVGGMGKRMLPHTESCPKPLLPVAGKPLLEHIIVRAKQEGFHHFILAIHYLGNMIESYFGNGESLGVQIDYLREQSPLGTAGALGLLSPTPNLPFIVTNGDVLTDIRYAELLDFHIRQDAAATMAVRLHEWQNPCGVVQTQGVEILGFVEKPISRSHINAGVYVLDPPVLNLLGKGIHIDMPTLFEKLKKNGQRTVAYPMHELWLDVGRPEDLAEAGFMYQKFVV